MQGGAVEAGGPLPAAGSREPHEVGTWLPERAENEVGGALPPNSSAPHRRWLRSALVLALVWLAGLGGGLFLVSTHGSSAPRIAPTAPMSTVIPLDTAAPTSSDPGSSTASSAGYALSFTSAHRSYLDIPASSSLNLTTSFTLEAWMYQSQAIAYGYRLIDKVTANMGEGYDLDTYDPNGTGRRLRLVGGPSGWTDANTVYTLDAWHHVAVSVSGAIAMFYIDGRQVGSGAITTPPTNLLDLYIGGPHIGCGGTCGTAEYFSGLLDDVRIWDIARTQRQIQQTMHTTLRGNEPGLVAYYPFNEGKGSVTADMSGHCNLATLINNPIWIPSTAPINAAPGGAGTARQPR